MMVQRILKGINQPLSEAEAREILEQNGIHSNWWRKQGTITPPEVVDQLTEDRLLGHLNDYETAGPKTPFISTTAGSVVRDAAGKENLLFTADYVATAFATDQFTKPGWVFSGYLFTLGRKAVSQWGFSEEVRELHTYTGFLPYQPEGEIVAKVYIPAVQLEEAWPVKPRHQPSRTRYASKGEPISNERCYVDPKELLNLQACCDAAGGQQAAGGAPLRTMGSPDRCGRCDRGLRNGVCQRQEQEGDPGSRKCLCAFRQPLVPGGAQARGPVL